MKTLLIPILLVGSVATAGVYFLLSLIANNPYGTLAYRLSHQFFTVYTILPLSIITLGCIILVWCIFFRKFNKDIRIQITIFSTLVILVGFSTFGLYLID